MARATLLITPARYARASHFHSPWPFRRDRPYYRRRSAAVTRSAAYGPSSARSGDSRAPAPWAWRTRFEPPGSEPQRVRRVRSRRVRRLPRNITLRGATFFGIPTYSSRARGNAELDKKIDQGLASESRHSHSAHPSDHSSFSLYTNHPTTPCVSQNIPLTFSWHGPFSPHHSQRPKRTQR